MTASNLSSGETPGTPPAAAPRGRPYTETREFAPLVVLGALAVGALFGAAAVILSPQGSGTRRDFGRQLRRLRRLARRDRTPWEKLRRTLDRAAKHRRRAARRAQGSVVVADEPIAG